MANKPGKQRSKGSLETPRGRCNLNNQREPRQTRMPAMSDNPKGLPGPHTPNQALGSAPRPDP
eukprot:scaffold87471_cov28-Tisochrysis_lutea.AAC.1